MFTGLIEEVGEVSQIERSRKSLTLVINSTKVKEDLEPGHSIAVDGVCLTITKVLPKGFEVFLSKETVGRTILGKKQAGDKVNLERAIKAGDRLGGHFVLGHVDAIGRIKQITKAKDTHYVTFSVPAELMPYLVPKGSVAVDGISLTIVDVFTCGFSIAIIPYTLDQTTLRWKKVGDEVNIESDILARYISNLMSLWPAMSKNVKPVDMELLKHTGFIE